MDAAAIASRLLYAAAWCVGRLPLGVQRWLGDVSGAAMRLRDGRESKVARRNLALVAPALDPEAAAALHRDVLKQTGRLGVETLRIWTRPRADNLALVAAVHGEDVLRAALDAGRGVIVAAPHYGNHELVIEWMAARGPFALVYRAPESATGDRFLRLARGGENVVLVPAEASAMRPLLKSLQAGGVVGITPDQQPKEGAGEFAPFFGRPAQTLSLIPRLAARTGAAVLAVYAERRADGRFDLHVEPMPDALRSDDLPAALAAMNAAVEAIARRDMSQYQWTYKRFSRRPPGSPEPNPYKQDFR
jgi:KDO2-lipid IV(A) lauroyltransferase